MAIFLEWLVREGWIFLSWWFFVTLAGIAVLPLCFRLLGGLPDKGYTLARTVGLLLVGFVYWFLASLGFLQNTAGNIMFAWLLVLGIGLTLYFRTPNTVSLRQWWHENGRVVIIAEILFFVLFFTWTVFRAYQSDITNTEKPMELAFMSAVQRSDTFPPNDPWMSGYAISYYYFGYVMSAMLSMLSGTPSTIGFNMTIALLFGLTGLTSFGVVYNLVRSRRFNWQAPLSNQSSYRAPISVGLLAMIFVILMGNFQHFLVEIPFQSRSLPPEYFDFWRTQERDATVYQDLYSGDVNPLRIQNINDWSNWWWFRASRTLNDNQLDGSPPPSWYAQPIDEFPAFSFILADNHPHVLALPFAVLALGMALNILLTARDPNRYEILLYGLGIGGLVFLNAWDGPIYLFALLGTDALRRLFRQERGRLNIDDWIGLVIFGGALLGITILAYLPFFVGFRSQASGFLPNILYPTAPQHFFLMFAPFVLLLPAFLLLEAWRGKQTHRMNWRFGLSITGLLLFGLLLFVTLLMIASAFVPNLRASIQGYIDQNGGWDVIVPSLIERRLVYGFTSLGLLAGIVVILARLFPKASAKNLLEDNNQAITYSPATGFGLLLVAMGLVLCLVPEFFYLRDNFGAKINTIFKFYYQAWVMFSLATAYGIYSFFAEPFAKLPAKSLRIAYAIVGMFVLFAGLLYPILGVYSRMMVETGRYRVQSFNHFFPESWQNPQFMVTDGQFVERGTLLVVDNDQQGNQVLARHDGQVKIAGREIYIVPSLTLDGGRSMVQPDDYDVIQCLNDLVDGDEVVVAEASRDAYNSQYGRIGALTGIPIVLGWENHERQWRGSTYPQIAGTRRFDLDELYSDLRWDVAKRIIQEYDIDYIMFGYTERAQFGSIGEQKFIDFLEVVCEAGTSHIYQVTDSALARDF